MPFLWDAVKRSFFSAARAANPRVDYFALYRATVVSPSSNGLIDCQPDDPRLPGFSQIPLRNGIPGLSVSIKDGAAVLVGWDSGDPSKPYCCLFEGGETVVSLTLTAAQINLGAPNLVPATAGVVLGACVDPFTGAPHFALGGTSKTIMAAP